MLKKLESGLESLPKHTKKIVFDEDNSVRRLPMPTGNIENLIPTVYKYHEDDDFLVGEDVSSIPSLLLPFSALPFRV